MYIFRNRTRAVFWYHVHVASYQISLISVKRYLSYRTETTFADTWAMTFDLWPTYAEIKLELYFDTRYLHIKFHWNPSNTTKVIERKPNFRIFNELWTLTFDLRMPKSNLSCILIPGISISNFIEIRQTLLKLSNGNHICGYMDYDLWPLTYILRNRTRAVFWYHIPSYQISLKSVKRY